MGKTCLPDRQAKAGIKKEHLVRFLLCGLTGVAVNQMLFIKGLTMTSTIHASLLMLCTPLLIVLNAIAYTLFFILVKPLMSEYPPLHVIRWVFSFGFIMILPFGWMQFSSIQWSLFEWSHIVSLVSIVLFGTFLAYLFNAYGLQKLGAGITGSYIYTQPVFTAVIAILFLHEHFTIEKLAAGLMIFAGVFLVSRKAPPVVME